MKCPACGVHIRTSSDQENPEDWTDDWYHKVIVHKTDLPKEPRTREQIRDSIIAIEGMIFHIEELLKQALGKYTNRFKDALASERASLKKLVGS